MTALLVPGALTTARVWSPVATLLRAELGEVYVNQIQLPGHPDGDALESVAAYAEQVAAASRSGTWLIGYAMGAAIVLEAACGLDARPAGVVLVNASARMRVSPELIAGAKRDGRSQARAIWRASSGSPLAQRVLLDEFDRLDPRTAAVDLCAIDSWSRTGRLDALANVPALVIVGEQDRFVARKGSEALAAETGADLAVLPGGHCLPLECPDLVSRRILDLIDTHEHRRNQRDGST